MGNFLAIQGRAMLSEEYLEELFGTDLLFLNQKEPFIHLLVKILSQQMGTAFPELVKEQQLAFNVIKEEENSFLKTLEQGLVRLESILSENQREDYRRREGF